MEPEEERAAAELRRINAGADKLAAEADKLEAEEQRSNSSVVKDAWTIGLGRFSRRVSPRQSSRTV